MTTHDDRPSLLSPNRTRCPAHMCQRRGGCATASAAGPSGARAAGGDQRAAGHARHRALPRDERGSVVAAEARGLPPEGPCLTRQTEAWRGGLGQWRVLGGWRQQPLPPARDRLAWISGDRERPHSERPRRAAEGAASSDAPRTTPRTAHAGIGSDRRRRLGTCREQARWQSVLRPPRPGAHRVFGLELRRRTGAASGEGSTREGDGDSQQRHAEQRANHDDRRERRQGSAADIAHAGDLHRGWTHRHRV